MKKSLFAAAVVALALVSCNKKAEEKVEAVDSADSTAAVVDSAAVEVKEEVKEEVEAPAQEAPAEAKEEAAK